MATKKEVASPELIELRNKLTEGKAVIGRNTIIKLLRQKGVKKVYLAKNCPASIRQEMGYYGKLGNVPIVEVELNNHDLGIFCKKQFVITVLGIRE